MDQMDAKNEGMAKSKEWKQNDEFQKQLQKQVCIMQNANVLLRSENMNLRQELVECKKQVFFAEQGRHMAVAAVQSLNEEKMQMLQGSITYQGDRIMLEKQNDSLVREIEAIKLELLQKDEQLLKSLDRIKELEKVAEGKNLLSSTKMEGTQTLKEEVEENPNANSSEDEDKKQTKRAKDFIPIRQHLKIREENAYLWRDLVYIQESYSEMQQMEGTMEKELETLYTRLDAAEDEKERLQFDLTEANLEIASLKDSLTTQKGLVAFLDEARKEAEGELVAKIQESNEDIRLLLDKERLLTEKLQQKDKAYSSLKETCKRLQMELEKSEKDCKRLTEMSMRDPDEEAFLEARLTDAMKLTKRNLEMGAEILVLKEQVRLSNEETKNSRELCASLELVMRGEQEEVAEAKKEIEESVKKMHEQQEQWEQRLLRMDTVERHLANAMKKLQGMNKEIMRMRTVEKNSLFRVVELERDRAILTGIVHRCFNEQTLKTFVDEDAAKSRRFKMVSDYMKGVVENLRRVGEDQCAGDIYNMIPKEVPEKTEAGPKDKAQGQEGEEAGARKTVQLTIPVPAQATLLSDLGENHLKLVFDKSFNQAREKIQQAQAKPHQIDVVPSVAIQKCEELVQEKMKEASKSSQK